MGAGDFKAFTKEMMNLNQPILVSIYFFGAGANEKFTKSLPCDYPRGGVSSSWFTMKQGKIVQYLEMIRLLEKKATFNLISGECGISHKTVTKDRSEYRPLSDS